MGLRNDLGCHLMIKGAQRRMRAAFPSSTRRGGCGSRKFREASLLPQTGWSSRPSVGSILDHPVRSAKDASRHLKDASRHLLMSRPPLLVEEGNVACDMRTRRIPTAAAHYSF